MQLKQFNPMKILYHMDRVNEYLNGGNVYPVTVEIDPSNVCNHDCVWCTFEDYRGKNRDVIPKDILIKLVQDLASADVKGIVWTGGGDPLTHPDIMEVVEYASKFEFKMGFFTNGGLLNENKIKALGQTCKFIRISLDAGTKKTHTKLHRPCNGRKEEFDEIIGNIESLVEFKRKTRKDFDVGIAFLVHPANYHEIYDAALMFKEMGVDYFQLKPVVMFNRKQLSPEIFKNTHSIITEAMSLRDNDFDVIPLDYKFSDIVSGETDYGRTYTECLGHPFIGTIGADCNVYLCCHLRGKEEFSFGSLKDKSFIEIWNSDYRQEVIKKIDLRKCQPLCKAHEINKLLDFIKKPKYHEEFL